MYKVVLWGGGKGYNAFVYLHGLDMVNVIAIVDSNTNFYKKIDGFPMIKPEELAELEFEYLIVTVLDKNIFNEIVSQAQEIGILREKIIPVSVFELPFFDFDEYIELKKSNVSILSDYCAGGYLYHRFGFEFTSPTINMFVTNENYLNFLRDVEGHLNMPMEKVDSIVDSPFAGGYAYPRGRVGDAEWCFNHDETFEDGARRWEKGAKLFNVDNFVVIMVIRSEEAAYQFEALPVKYKIGFYWKDIPLKSIVYLPEWENCAVRKKHNYNFAYFVNRVVEGGNAIDWMRFLMHKDNYVRVE